MLQQLTAIHVIGLAWLAMTLVLFATQTASSAVSPIAVDALSSLFLVYFTVLALCAFLWLYLTCGRDELGCETLYTVERSKLGSQVQLAFACLLVKQLILGV